MNDRQKNNAQISQRTLGQSRSRLIIQVAESCIVLRAIRRILIVVPIHPRTRKRVERFGLAGYFSSSGKPQGHRMAEPRGDLEFFHLNMHARMVITESCGLQEETAVLGVPCMTLRNNTERPITCEVGT